MRNILTIMTVCFLAACGTTKEYIPGPVEYLTVPEAFLQECVLPPLPEDTADLSDAFVQAYMCGEQGNVDKQRIRNLTSQ